MADTDSTAEVVVIGGGPGGYAAAFMAADLGKQVTLVDLDENPGGTCLYRGCIPSKALLHAAKILNEAKEAEHWGIHFETPRIDIDQLRATTQGVVSKLTGGLGQLSKARKITYLQGRASFIDSSQLRVHLTNGDIELVTFQDAILATGSRPATLAHLMTESPKVMNSTDALELEDVPERLLVIGGGYIGLELTTVYAALGSKVTVVDFALSILPGADKDLVRPLKKKMESICEAIYVGTGVKSLEDTGDGVLAVFDGEHIEQPEQTFDKVLISVGRKPNSSGVGLETTKVKVNDQGFVEVDAQLRTAEPHIFAIGDLVGQPMLAHKASHEGMVAAEVIAGHKVAFDKKCIPAVVFTDPEVAWVGLMEEEAKAAGHDIKVGRFPWSALSRATTLNANEGVTKLIADAETEAIIGIGICGTGAGEMIAEAALAIEMGATAADIHLTIHPHPTLSESVMEAAELIYGRTSHLYKPQKK